MCSTSNTNRFRIDACFVGASADSRGETSNGEQRLECRLCYPWQGDNDQLRPLLVL